MYSFAQHLHSATHYLIQRRVKGKFIPKKVLRYSLSLNKGVIVTADELHNTKDLNLNLHLNYSFTLHLYIYSPLYTP